MEQKLRTSIKYAMLAKKIEPNMENTVKLQTLKNILETAQKIAKEKQVPVTDSMIVDAAKKEIKQLNDLETFCENDAEKLTEIAFCKSVAKEFLPRMATEEEIKDFLKEYSGEIANMGIAMKMLKEKFGDALDGKLASQIIKDVL